MSKLSVIRVWPLIILVVFFCMFLVLYRVLKAKNINKYGFYVNEFHFGTVFYCMIIRYISHILLCVSMVMLIFASMGISIEKIESKMHLDEEYMLFVIDVSPSMSIHDVNNNSRINVIKSQLTQFLRSIYGVSVGVVLFSDTINMLVPFSKNYDAVIDMISSIQIGSLGNGSAIVDALLYSAHLFTSIDSSKKKMILITDGVQNSGQSSIKDLLKYKNFFSFPIVFAHIGTNNGGYFKYDDIYKKQTITGYVKGEESILLQNITQAIDVEEYRLQELFSIKKFFYDLQLNDTYLQVIQDSKVEVYLTQFFLWVFCVCIVIALIINVVIFRSI